jgi:di/tricarboxylate transporter
MLSLDAWIAIAVTVVVFSSFQLRRNAPSDVLFLGGLVAVTVTGVLSPEQAISSFSNPAVLAIGGLLAVSAGLRHTGVLDWVGHRLLGNVETEGAALRRLGATLLATSAFVLNTALVAMMLPVVVEWCRRRHVSPSRMLIPLSYLTILGGVCTLIGTSTTLVANGKLQSRHDTLSAEITQRRADLGDRASHQQLLELEWQERFRRQVAPMGLFEIGRIGLPCALVGAAVLLLLGRYLLPNRVELIDQLGERRREYLVEMFVQNGCRLIGQTVAQAGLRQLPGLFLIEIDRGDEVITPVTPEDTIHGGDRLVFTGVVDTIVDLEKIPGLVPAADMTYEFHPSERQQRHLTEVVLSRTSPIIGATVRETSFRQLYNAAVVAVHRNGVRLTNKVGDIRLEPGDTLLLQTRAGFVKTYRNSRDFYLVSSVDGEPPRRHDRAVIAGGLGLLLILWLSLSCFRPIRECLPSLASPAIAALAIAGLMVATRCLRATEVRSAIDLQLLLTIVGALGLGSALEVSGAAHALAQLLVDTVGSDNPYLLLIVVYGLALVLTELITNNAVAATLLPLAIGVAEAGQYNPRPFIMAIALAASLSFLTPLGYQTNLMVLGPGGYRPPDYLRAGAPVTFAVAVTALILIPMIWPFSL